MELPAMEKEYKVTLTQGELDGIHKAIYQLDCILCEIDGSEFSGFNVVSVERLINLEELAQRLYEQTHDDNGEWL